MDEFKDKVWKSHIVKYSLNKKRHNPKGVVAGTCLSGFFGYLKDTEDPFSLYEFCIPKGYIALSLGYSDWCPFERPEIIRTLEDIGRIIDFEYKFTESDNFFRLVLKISNKGKSEERNNHFYLLTRTRYLHQYPYCVLYKDAMRLSGRPEFSDWSLQDLYSLCIETNPERINIDSRKSWYDSYHSVQLHPKNHFIEKKSNEEIRSILRRSKFYMEALNSIYGIQEEKTSVKIPNNGLLCSLAYWRDEFESRVPYYLANKKGYTTNQSEDPGFPNYLEVKNRVKNTEIDLGDKDKNSNLVYEIFGKRIAETLEF
jgi:hypothetical protein